MCNITWTYTTEVNLLHTHTHIHTRTRTPTYSSTLAHTCIYIRCHFHHPWLHHFGNPVLVVLLYQRNTLLVLKDYCQWLSDLCHLEIAYSWYRKNTFFHFALLNKTSLESIVLWSLSYRRLGPNTKKCHLTHAYIYDIFHITVRPFVLCMHFSKSIP